MPSVSIAIQPDIFDRFSDLNFKPSQALAEFVDNAIQSYLDFKNNSMFYTSGYKLVVDIDIEWAESSDRKTYAKCITIKDNAAGIALDKFGKAFETGHRPAFNEGLNEYGMGMKTAAYWLSQQWSIVSKSFSESVERTLSFDVDDIVKNRRTKLDFQETHVGGNKSYTIVRLKKLHQKNNFTKRMLPFIIQELASIYRAFLRRGEIQININQEALVFQDPKILVAPYYSDPNGEPLEWKVQISKDLFGKQITGYIGILSEMSEKQSGLVIMRRGRVIVGESSEHLYHPSGLFGTYKNGFVYKRLYGEIEIKGFSASFNKNGFSNMDELETMLEMLKKTLKVEGYDLLRQAKELRVNPPKPTQTVTVRWNFGNGAADKVDSVEKNSIISKPSSPSRKGYTFKGWKPEVSSTALSDVTYTAIWEEVSEPSPNPAPQTVQVQWVLDNGFPNKVETYKCGESIKVQPKPHKTGYIFEGWRPAITSIVECNAIYTAQWKKVDTEPSTNIVAEKVFSYNGANAKMQLIKTDDKAPLLSINMTKFGADKIVIALLNVDILPIADKTIISDDVKNILLSIAIGMFETQMKGEDTCDGLMKNIKQ